MPACKRCGSDAVFWAKRPGKRPYDRGAFVLLDREPDPHGLYAIRDGRAVLVEHVEDADEPRYLPHEALCEAAGQPRRSPLHP